MEEQPQRRIQNQVAQPRWSFFAKRNRQHFSQKVSNPDARLGSKYPFEFLKTSPEM